MKGAARKRRFLTVEKVAEEPNAGFPTVRMLLTFGEWVGNRVMAVGYGVSGFGILIATSSSLTG